MTLEKIIKLLAYITIFVFIINRIISRPAEPEKPPQQPTLDIPAYVTESQDPRGLVLGGRKLVEEGKLELAEVAFKRATELDPKLRDAWLYLGITRLALGKNFEAEVALRRAKAIDPLHAETYRQLIKLYETTGEKEAAAATQRSLEVIEK
ncbi:tetratricopeptide repeat protein [Candidatus Berkelbacteria bacterium]|nr:tetratricopeptide repeat protein [Candidatus Berkelbacteria bacterium]